MESLSSYQDSILWFFWNFSDQPNKKYSIMKFVTSATIFQMLYCKVDQKHGIGTDFISIQSKIIYYIPKIKFVCIKMIYYLKCDNYSILGQFLWFSNTRMWKNVEKTCISWNFLKFYDLFS